MDVDNLRTVSGHHKMAVMLPVLLFTFIVMASAATTTQPNIVVIVADDLGFNDMSFRGSIDIPTPNIDALAYTGRILDRHYVLPTCTPSRTALLTGKYPVRTGMQGYPIRSGEKRALPAQFTVLPQYLKKLNYSTHLIGKWHQGFYKWNYTPTYRGFDSFFGYYNGFIGYFDHTILMSNYTPKAEEENPPLGLDMRRNKSIAHDVQGVYATELFTRETEQLIRNHNKENPLFIDLSHLAVHAGKDAGTMMEVEDEAENNKTFGFIQDPQRRRMAGAMTSLDKSVGRIVKALADNNMIENTIILFIADNGGETVGMHSNAGSNYPLRGQKFTQFEGAVRGAGVIWHAGMKPTDVLYSDYVHITDWIPTFYEAAGGDVAELDDVDGISQWGKLNGRTTEAPRTELLVNSEFLVNTNETLLGRSYIDGPWKLVWGNVYPTLSVYSGESGHTEGAKPYDWDDMLNSETINTLLSASKLGKEGLAERAQHLRKLATLPKGCRDGAPEEVPTCETGCLFNIIDDPCEAQDVSAQHPDIVASLKAKLEAWQKRTVPQLNTLVDTESDPRDYCGVWVPWKDVRPRETPCLERSAPTSSESSPLSELQGLFTLMEDLWLKIKPL